MQGITLEIIHTKHIKILAHALSLARKIITVRLLRSGSEMMRYIGGSTQRRMRAAPVVV
jgi:hypothetical protein